MAKKHLAAVSLLIVLIFGLTACVCRSSDTAISVPVYDKPASATANNRTMQDETATKSSSEKSSEATTESAQSEDASALIFPNPCSEQFDLSERDAVLFDAAVAARNRTPNADICIPEIGGLWHIRRSRKNRYCVPRVLSFLLWLRWYGTLYGQRRYAGTSKSSVGSI